MRKFMAFFMSAMLVLSLAACGGKQRGQEPEAANAGPQAGATGGAADKVPDPNAEPMEIISIYSCNDDGSGLNQAMDAVDKLTAEALTDKLIEYGVLVEGTKVLAFDTADETGTLDLSELPSGKGVAEQLIKTAVANTFIENFELDQLKLLVKGKNVSGGDGAKGNGYLEYVKNYKALK